MKKQKTAVDFLMAGHSCSQAMVMAYFENHQLPRDLASRMASGFAGGMAQGKTCGAVIGAIMVAGLKFGPKSAKDTYEKDHCFQITQEFCLRFKRLRTTVECHEILRMNQIDPQDTESMKQLREKGLCREIVQDAQQILDQLFKEEE
ncbi:MAG: C_GCAxxG_C_C family protein [Desulfobacter sp.]|nr:C_GCAxxG_C_C family protein [Desulfobacter sp.]WDP87691.1 MAG: C_GCAxxG_C_C family protein [Desulfobacter sp.]